jgi:hypothetical protein
MQERSPHGCLSAKRMIFDGLSAGKKAKRCFGENDA